MGTLRFTKGVVCVRVHKGPFIKSVTRDKGRGGELRLVFERDAAQNTLKILRDDAGEVNLGPKKGRVMRDGVYERHLTPTNPYCTTDDPFHIIKHRNQCKLFFR